MAPMLWGRALRFGIETALRFGTKSKSPGDAAQCASACEKKASIFPRIFHLANNFRKVLIPQLLHLNNKLLLGRIQIIARLHYIRQQRKKLPRHLQFLVSDLALEASAFRQRQTMSSAHNCRERFAVGFRTTYVIQAPKLGHARARLTQHILGRDARQPQHLARQGEQEKIARKRALLRGAAREFCK